MMGLIHKEQTDGVEIEHAQKERNPGCPNYPNSVGTVIDQRQIQ